MIQTMEEIIRRFCEYGMEYKDYAEYIHNWVTLPPQIQLAYNTRKHSTTRISPSLVEKGWNHLFPVDHLKKNILNIHSTAKHLHDMWKKECDTALRCIAEEKLIGKTAVEVILTKEFSRKHLVFSVSLVRTYHQTGEDKLPLGNKSHTPQDIVESEDFPVLVNKIMKARKIRLNGKEHKQYLVRFNNQTATKDKWLAEDAIPDGDLHLRLLRASRRAENSHE
ncbi:hypothetical protein O181_069059 [Austropuccinia psidii MF-1]|uniref:Chromo domain-containing protein n=1 Tax=Austropuccinia psidii MF-1 TaxID=1389203 RepID=A0A9Q3I860_9BASI|nr:hypothetical protein [Austropuccinia psidii MF-1]